MSVNIFDGVSITCCCLSRNRDAHISGVQPVSIWPVSVFMGVLDESDAGNIDKTCTDFVAEANM